MKFIQYIVEHPHEMSVKMGVSIGGLGGIVFALYDPELRAEGSDSVGYGLLGLGICGAAVGGMVGNVLGMGLEKLVQKYGHSVNNSLHKL